MLNEIHKTKNLNVLNSFNKLMYVWDLEKDSIQWESAIGQNFHPITSSISGNSYFQYLTFDDFWYRMAILSEKAFSGEKFSIHYSLLLPEGIQNVYEEGYVELNSKGHPYKISGCLHIQEHNFEDPRISDFSGYDPLTHLGGPEVLSENLNAYLVQTKFSRKLCWAFVVVNIDNLAYLNCRYGVHSLRNTLKVLSQKTIHHIHFDDFIGHCHAASFGIVAKECDEKGIASLSNRLLEAFNAENSNIMQDIKFSIGGVVFPSNDVYDAYHLMNKAQDCISRRQAV
jgi:GGDEF domain-containing protein